MEHYVVCVFCGEKNRTNVSYCQKCGAQIICESCGEKAIPTSSYCQKCGTKQPFKVERTRP